MGDVFFSHQSPVWPVTVSVAVVAVMLLVVSSAYLGTAITLIFRERPAIIGNQSFPE